nr:RHS repeat-associated core domain-containing protein [Rubrivivax pictus]
MVTKADQVVQASFGYEPFGRTTQTTPAGQPVSDIPYQYTGRENEAASATGNQATAPLASLYYYRNRFYSVALQRFVSEDPIDLAGGSNFYTYVGGAPAFKIDPLGLLDSSPGAIGNSLDPAVELIKVVFPDHQNIDIPLRAVEAPLSEEMKCQAKCNLIAGQACKGAVRAPGGFWGKGAAYVGCNAGIYLACKKACKPADPCEPAAKERVPALPEFGYFPDDR